MNCSGIINNRGKYYDVRRKYHQILFEKLNFYGFNLCLIYLSMMPLLTNFIVGEYFQTGTTFILLFIGMCFLYVFIRIAVGKVSIEYPTIAFLSISLIGMFAGLGFVLWYQGIENIDVIYFLLFSILFSIVLYVIFTFCMPIDRLLLLNSKAAFWSSFIILVVPVVLIIFLRLLPDTHYFIGAYLIDQELAFQGEASPLLLQLFEENEEIFQELAVLLASRESISYFERIFDRVAFMLSFSYLIGGTIVQLRIRRNKKNAFEKYENVLILLDNIKDDDKGGIYNELKHCVYTGGDELRRLILNNERIRQLIVEIEFRNIDE